MSLTDADAYSVGYNAGYTNGYRDALRQLKRTIDEKAAINDSAFTPYAGRANQAGGQTQLTLSDPSITEDRRHPRDMLDQSGHGQAAASEPEAERDT